MDQFNKDAARFLAGEDEMEFIPIIPLNEQEHENGQEGVIPSVLPLLPLRNTVLFPGVVLPITVGRDKSIKAINDAYKADKLVGVIAQKDSAIEDPEVSRRCEAYVSASPGPQTPPLSGGIRPFWDAMCVAATPAAPTASPPVMSLRREIGSLIRAPFR